MLLSLEKSVAWETICEVKRVEKNLIEEDTDLQVSSYSLGLGGETSTQFVELTKTGYEREFYMDINQIDPL